MSIKKALQNILKQYPPALRCASRLYYALNRSFMTLSPGTPGALLSAFKKAKELYPEDTGDYYEFGLFRGYSFWKAQQICKELKITDTHFYGFDSFKGLPELKPSEEVKGQFFKGQFSCSKAQVVHFLTRRRIDWSKVTLIEGFYNETLTQNLKNEYPFHKVAVALIDCDLYSSTRDVLIWLSDMLREGSILLFDDWRSLDNDPQLGQQRAFKEFLEADRRYSAEQFLNFKNHGTAFIMHTR